jgi:hypothetical protein
MNAMQLLKDSTRTKNGIKKPASNTLAQRKKRKEHPEIMRLPTERVYKARAKEIKVLWPESLMPDYYSLGEFIGIKRKHFAEATSIWYLDQDITSKVKKHPNNMITEEDLCDFLNGQKSTLK